MGRVGDGEDLGLVEVERVVGEEETLPRGPLGVLQEAVALGQVLLPGSGWNSLRNVA